MVSSSRKRSLNITFTPQANNLLNKVNLARKIWAVCRSNNAQLSVVCWSNLAAKARKARNHKLFWNLSTCKRANALWAKRNSYCLFYLWIYINNTRANLSTTAFLKECCCNICNRCTAVWIHKTLVANRSLAHQIKVSAGTANVAVIKDSGFQKDINGILGNFRIQATHNTCKCNRSFTFICDDRHIGRELAVFSVKRHNVLTVFCSTNHNVVLAIFLGKFSEVKSMQRLAGQVHHVVSNINNVVD